MANIFIFWLIHILPIFIQILDKEITVNKSKTKTMKAKRKEKVEKRKRFSIEREKAVKIQENAIFS